MRITYLLFISKYFLSHSIKINSYFLCPLSPFEELGVVKQVEIKASPAVVWNALVSSNQADIKRQGLTFSTFFGFPHHLNTTVGKVVVGGSRVANYEKGLTFNDRCSTGGIESDPSD